MVGPALRPLESLYAAILLCSSLILLASQAQALKCLDCVGKDCMGSFCEGDYCVLSYYAPRWGTLEWGEPRLVKGCMTGSMLRHDVRSHCETVDEDGQDVFTCFCNNKDYCNSDKAADRLAVEPVQLLNCACEGSHCKGATCTGELCSYVINHRTSQVEQGCVNASVPLVERRSAGACMIPPITGAMHHTVAKDAEDLLVTESCVCGTDYCNMEKPEPKANEWMKCQAFVRAEVMGTKMASRNVSCTGEYCFKAKISSKLGHMSKYSTIGCASFVDEAELAEELNPTGCAKFASEKVEVEACFQTNDKRAIGRARASQAASGKPARQRGPKSRPKMEVDYEEPAEEEEEEEAAKEEESTDEEDEEKAGGGEGKSRETATTSEHFIFERPTLPPEIDENSNTALISVFLLIMLLIVLSGAVWKLELHKRLFRANYDTVAGG